MRRLYEEVLNSFEGQGAVYAGLRVCERTDCTDGNG